jgi:hypothetical protein
MAREQGQSQKECETGTGAPGVLAEYESHKHAIAQLLREIHAAAYEAKNESLERAVQEVTHKLAEDRFYLTVVGQFSRGKSTLMNAILGKEYLPSGIVTERINPGNRDRIQMAELAEASFAPNEALATRLASLRAGIKGGGSVEESGTWRKKAPHTGSVLKVSCAVCDGVVDAVLDFLRHYQYELYVSAVTQQSHARAGGFCPMHTWQYASLASPQGICSAYPQTLLRFSEDLLSLAEGSSPKYVLNGVVEPPLPADTTCPACVKAREAEQAAVRDLVRRLESAAEGNQAAEPRFCLTHLEAMLLALRDLSVAKRLLEREGEMLRRIAENLQRYALRHEGRRSDLIAEEEWHAPRQALTLLAGHHSVQPHFGR